MTKEIEPAVEPVGVDVIWPAGVTLPSRVEALIEFALAQKWGHE